MIGALSPRHASETGTALDVRSPPPEPQTNFGSTLEDELVPKPDWHWFDYEFAYFRAIVLGHTDKASNIDQAFLGSEEARRDDNRERWIATCEYSRLICSKDGSLATLRNMANAHPESSGTLEQFARGLSFFKEHGQAADAYEKAAREARDEADKLRLLGRASVELSHAGEQELAAKIIAEMKGSHRTSREVEMCFLGAIYDLAEFDKNDELCCAILERILEIDPDNNQKRFSLAYKYSEIGNDVLSVYHYLRIPDEERWSYAWNNLGVEFDRVGLVAKSVSAYRKAEGMGETLAMSNLAKKLMAAGFIDEAEALCTKASAIPRYHQNVARDIANLRDVPDEEDKKQSEVIERAKPSSAFLRAFDKAWSCCDSQDFAGTWIDANCELTGTLNGSEFQAMGTFENSGLGLLGGLYSTGALRTVERFNVKFQGKLSGRAVNGYVSRTREGGPVTTLLSALENQIGVLMILDDEANEIRVMENIRGASPRFYSLRRKVGEAVMTQ